MLFNRVLFLLLFSFCVFAQFETNPYKGIAVVVIDMQEKFFTRNPNWNLESNMTSFQSLIDHQMKVLNRAKKLGLPILKIKFDGFGSFVTNINKSLKHYINLRTFIKTSNNFLYRENPSTEKVLSFLNTQKIGNLIILGINGGSCVLASIRGAMQNTFNVIADVNGILDLNKRNYIYPYQNLYSFHRQLFPANFRESLTLSDTLQSLEDSTLFYNQ